MIETVFDRQTAKLPSPQWANTSLDQKERLPMMLSLTIVDSGGRTLSGQTFEAFYVSAKHAHASTADINWALRHYS